MDETTVTWIDLVISDLCFLLCERLPSQVIPSGLAQGWAARGIMFLTAQRDRIEPHWSAA